jgi:phosphoribosylformylglycinamidine synthase
VALLREQGLSGYTEMAAALSLAGFAVTDLHMTDLRHGSTKLQQASGLVVCGNGAYGNVCGAGVAWAHSIRHNTSLMEQLSTFFQRPETFTLGVANGCQLLAQLKDIVPGAVDWPTFTQNISDRFEARYLTVEVMKSPSILLQGMAGSRLPVAVAHQEGRAINVDPTCAALRYVDNYGAAALRYPLNPDGSDEGLCAFTTTDGRATIMMARPERGFRAVQLSYKPENTFTGEAGPWMRLFHNAYTFATTQA